MFKKKNKKRSTSIWLHKFLGFYLLIWVSYQGINVYIHEVFTKEGKMQSL